MATNKDAIISPLRYPGSKRRLACYIEKGLRLNSLMPKLYIEPFVGGASVALHLMEQNLVDKVILVDKDPLITGFWNTVFFDTEWLIDQIWNIDVSLESWHRYKNLIPITTRDNAIKCLFLNRTSFSGIMRPEVGPMGGREQLSKYKIDCRFPRDTLVNRIERIAGHKNKIEGIWACSWLEGEQHIKEMQSSGELPTKDVFYYFDPPFFKKANRLYSYYFDNDDHIRLRNFLLTLEDFWILSYDNSEQVETLYGTAIKNSTNGAKKHYVELIYSTGIMTGRKPTKEVIIANLKYLPTEARFWKTATGIKDT